MRNATVRIPCGSRAPRSIRRSLLLVPAFAGIVGGSGVAGCSHDWDAYDPRLAGSGGTGASGGTGGTATSTGGAGAADPSGGAGGTTTSTGGGGTGGQGGVGGTGGTASSTSSSSTGGGGAGGSGGEGGAGGSGGEGGAGGGPTRCGGTSVLADDFTGGDPGDVWIDEDWGGAVMAQSGGELVITLANDSPSGTGAYLETDRYYDFREDSVSVDVTSAANPQSSAYAWFGLGLDSDNYIEIFQEDGFLHFTREVGGTYVSLKTTLYDPTEHRHWRLRDDGADTYYETSSDGAAWTVQTQTPTAGLFPLDFVQIQIGAGADAGVLDPGEARFAHVNGGAPKQKWCPASSITDDFEDGMQGVLWARSWDGGSGLLTEKGGLLVLDLVPNDTSYSGRYSARSYDLTASSVVLEVPLATNPTSTSETSLHLHGPGGDHIQINKNQDQLRFNFHVADVETQVGSVLYSPVQHRWWRIREASDTLFWETSPDGKAWATQAQYSPVPIPVDALDVEITGGTWGAQPDPGDSHFDNLNLPPP